MADAGDDEPDPAPLAEQDDDIGSLGEQLKDLAEDTRTAVEAEIAWQQVRAGFVVGRLPGIAAWGGIAVLCVFIALLALAVGAILTLAPLIGAALATLVVVVVLLAVALIAGLSARSRVRQLTAAASSGKASA